LVVDLAEVTVRAGDEIHDVVLCGVLYDVLAVRGAGAGPVLVEQQSHRLALRVQEDLVCPADLQVEGDREGAVGGVTGLNYELVFVGETARERRRRRRR
jgi:hypothetical protein